MTFVNVCVWLVLVEYVHGGYHQDMFLNQCHLANEFFFFPEIVHKPVKGGGVHALSAFSYFH